LVHHAALGWKMDVWNLNGRGTASLDPGVVDE
jgi:hypothetical protein